MRARNRLVPPRKSVLIATMFTMCLASVGVGRSATGWTAAGFRAYAKFGHCTTGTAYKVYLYDRGSVTDTSGSLPSVSTGHYRIARETLVGTSCVTVDIDDRPSSQATIFKVSPDMSSAELQGPSAVGVVHVVWSAGAAPGPGTDPTILTPAPLAAGGGAFVERLASATGSVGSVVSTSTTASRASVRVGFGGMLTG